MAGFARPSPLAARNLIPLVSAVILVVAVLGYGEYAGWFSSPPSGEGCRILPFGAGYECSVNFTETGLPAKAMWTVNLPGRDASSLTSVVTFDEPNGTYAWHIDPVLISTALYAATPSSGNVTVSGMSVFVQVWFTCSGSHK